jgi:hypothetical protein
MTDARRLSPPQIPELTVPVLSLLLEVNSMILVG